MSESVVYRPKNCSGQSFSAYNVATWGELCGREVRHDKYGIGIVERSNTMSREAWVRFDHLRIVKLGNLEVLAEDGGVRPQDTDTGHAGGETDGGY